MVCGICHAASLSRLKPTRIEGAHSALRFLLSVFCFRPSVPWSCGPWSVVSGPSPHFSFQVSAFQRLPFDFCFLLSRFQLFPRGQCSSLPIRRFSENSAFVVFGHGNKATSCFHMLPIVKIAVAVIFTCVHASVMSKTGQLPVQLLPKGDYSAFLPASLPPALEWTPRLLQALSEADRKIGQLAGEGRRLPNPHLLLRPFVRREAVLGY
jgi:hypothetical protein